MKQAKVKTWLGGFQVQLSTSMSHYVVYINMSFVGMMFWYTTAAPALRPYLPWVSWWMFASIMLVIIVSLMVMDYIYIASSRYGFINKQAAKHNNPIVAKINKLQRGNNQTKKDLRQIKKDNKKIMEKLGIEDENN